MVKIYVPAAVMLLTFLFTSPADAYIDPNTGGFFFQTVAPFVYAMLGVIVVFWKRIAGFVKGLFVRRKDQDSSSSNE